MMELFGAPGGVFGNTAQHQLFVIQRFHTVDPTITPRFAGLNFGSCWYHIGEHGRVFHYHGPQ